MNNTLEVDSFLKLIEEAVDPLEDIIKTTQEVNELVNREETSFSFPYQHQPSVIQDYLNWAKVSTHAPDELIATGFLGVASAILGKQVAVIGPSGKRIYPNIWLSGLARSGVGKTTAFNIPIDLVSDLHSSLEESAIDALVEYKKTRKIYDKKVSDGKDPGQAPKKKKCKHIFLPSISSQQKLYETLARDYPFGMVATSEELSIVLADISSDRNSGFKPLMISLYGGSKVAPIMSYKNSEDLPLIKEPAIGIMGVSTPELLYKYFSIEDLYSGLLQRFLFVIPVENKPKLAFPPKRDRGKELYFSNYLKDLFVINPSTDSPITYELSEEARQYWIETYPKLDDEFGYVSDGAVQSCFSRINDEITFKLALIFHVLKDYKESYISRETLEQAVEQAKYHKHSLIFVIQQMKHKSSKPLMVRIIEKLRKNYDEGLSHRKLANFFRGYQNDAMDSALDELLDLKIIEVKEIQTDSRNGSISRTYFLLEELID